jgi:RNA polymerase sigma factor (sigma-70 family)
MALDRSFDDVLSDARKGEERAWAWLYDRLAPKVLGYLRTLRAPDPEDLLGEVFLQVVRDLPRFEGDEGAFRSWVFTVAHHRMLDDARYRARRPVSLVDEMPDALSAGDVEAEAMEGLKNSQMMAAIQALPHERRTVLLLRLFGGLKLSHIAEILGKSTGAVKQMQRRALSDLRKALDTPDTLFALEVANEGG